jgi:IS30 family transposase
MKMPEQIETQSNISPLDKKITLLLAEGLNISETAEKLDINRNTVSRHIKQNVAISQTLELVGITDKYLAEKTKEQIEANKKLYHPKTQEYIDVPDNQSRISAISLAYKVKGHLKENTTPDQNIVVNLVNYNDVPVDK